ncbi:hypothetical protein [Desulforhopalus sp. 52FAK]
MIAVSELNGELEEESRFFPKFLVALLACVVTCAGYYAFVVNTARVEVDIEVSQTSRFAIYWAEEGQGYSQNNMATVRAHAGKRNYSFYLTNLSKIHRLRIDPHTYLGEATIKQLQVAQEGYEPIILSNSDEFKRLVPLNQIETTRVDANGLWLRSTGQDPYFELTISPQKIGFNTLWLLVRMLGVALITLVIVYSLAPLVEKLKIVPILLFGVWILILVMAGISKENVHPDEYVHIAATSYYAENWLPPVVDDPSVRNTYSVYGVSRLNYGEIYYFFSGKTYKVLQFFQMPATFAYRFFNVALFGIIFFLSVRSVYARIAAIPFLVSSQVWYIFSYCGSDAFALFIAFLATYFLINPESLLHKYLKGGGAWFQFGAAMILAVFFGTVFILKMNYYPFVGLVYLILGVRIFFTEDYSWQKKDAVRRLIIITLLGASFLGIRMSADYVVNGFDRNDKIAALQEELSHYKYKKSTPPEERVPTIYMKDRGVAFKDLISKYHWGITTIQSSFGVFGYLSITSPHHYYTIVKWAGSALLLFILISSLTRGGIMGAGVTSVVCGLSLVLILAAIYRSWVVDFQPQGRYLFPIIPMFGIVLGHNIAAINKRVLVLLVGIMFMLGLYSYIFQGLLKIPRLPY